MALGIGYTFGYLKLRIVHSLNNLIIFTMINEVTKDGVVQGRQSQLLIILPTGFSPSGKRKPSKDI